MATDFQYDVFLSHNQADKPRVRWLAERLRAAGLRHPNLGFRISDFGFPAEAALSPAAPGSDWVGLERSTVLFRDPSNAGHGSTARLQELTEFTCATVGEQQPGTAARDTVPPPPRHGEDLCRTLPGASI
jgi:hypothetical protein